MSELFISGLVTLLVINQSEDCLFWISIQILAGMHVNCLCTYCTIIVAFTIATVLDRLCMYSNISYGMEAE